MNNILSIDLGSYSVKFLQYRLDRKTTHLIKYSEVSVDEYRKKHPELPTLEEIQVRIISDMVRESAFEGKIHIALPDNQLTYRFYHFPVKNIKKAHMMVPFQLDKDLLFPLKNLHYTSTLTKQKNGTLATIHMVNLTFFDKFFHLLETQNITPDKITSQLSILETLAQFKQIDGPYAIINLGHKMTNGFFFFQKRVVTNHLTFFGGQHIDELIAETYAMPVQQASFFKENQGHILLQNDSNEITPEQRFFSELMHRGLVPLVREIERWLIHYQMTLGLPVKKIFLIGGFAQLKNLPEYLATNLGIETEFFNPYTNKDFGGTNIPHELVQNGAILAAQMAGQNSKILSSNFLFGRYSTSSEDGIPLYSSLFIALRLSFVSVLVFLFLIGEKFFLYQQEKQLNARLEKVIKRKELGLLSRDQNKYQKMPEVPYKKLLEHKKAMSELLKDFSSKKNINALAPLIHMSHWPIKNDNVDLVHYQYAQEEAVLTFSASSDEEYKNFVKKIKELPIHFDLVENAENNQLTINIKDF